MLECLCECVCSHIIVVVVAKQNSQEEKFTTCYTSPPTKLKGMMVWYQSNEFNKTKRQIETATYFLRLQ